MQVVYVFQQNSSAISKIFGIQEYAADVIQLEIRTVKGILPPVIDDTSEYLDLNFQADLVLDYMNHPDLSQDLAAYCRKQGIPVIASGKRRHGADDGVYTPVICCALPRNNNFGAYGERFGFPKYSVDVNDAGIVTAVHVKRGAPCGATWKAAEYLIGQPVSEVKRVIGLKAQVYCSANPAGWEVIGGRSPVHLAGEMHAAAIHVACREMEIDVNIEEEGNRSNESA